MENQLTPGLQTSSNNLNQLVSRLVISVLPAAVIRKSFIVNDIPEELHVPGDEEMMATALGSLLNTVVSHSENSCIRISARVYGGIILVYMNDSGSFNSYSITCQLQQLQVMAKKMGGCISITRQQKEAPSIAFSLPYLAKAA
jgi:hypothetical protein